jgi:O-antigen ligase
MFGYFVTALATTWLLTDLDHLRRIVWFWVALICLQAFYGMTHAGRGYGSFLGDENDLALACAMAFPFPYLGSFRFRGAKRILCLAVTCLLVAGTVASFSRGGFLGLAAGFVYCVLIGRNRLRNLAIAGTAALLFTLLVPHTYLDELDTISETDSGTAENRFFLWTAATLMWKDHPLLGVGPGNAKFLLGEYNPKPTKSGLFSSPYYTDRVWSMRAIHSLYFELLAERGLVGVALFAAMLIGHYRILRRLPHSPPPGSAPRPSLTRDAELYGRALEASMTAFLVAAVFLSMLAYPYFWFFSALAVALDRAIRREWRKSVRLGTKARQGAEPQTSVRRSPA